MDRSAKKYLLIILFIGAGLRLWGINFGLPYQFHQDEPIIVNHALAYGTGDLNPHFFIIPPLTSYILFLFYGAYYLFLNVFGMVKGPEAFAAGFFNDPAPFYLIGRFITGFVPSVFNIYLAYKLTLKLFSKREAVYCAFMMAAAFLNVVNAHYIYTDNFLVMFVLLAYLAMASLIDKPTNINYAVTAVFIGIAAAIKYNAIILLAPFFIVHMISSRKNVMNALFDIKIFIFMSVVFISFITCNPYSLLDWKFFLLSVTGRIRQGYMGWGHHLAYSLFEGFGAIATICGIAGLVVLIKKDIKKALFLISFPAIFYLHLVYKSQPFSRYALTLIPFLSIGAAYLFYGYVYPKLRPGILRVSFVVLSIAVLLPSAIKSVKADILFTKPDTRIEAVEWIKNNIPARTKIAMDHIFFAPPIKQTVDQLKEKEAILNKQPELKALKGKKLDLQIKYSNDGQAYEVYYIVKGDEDIGQFLSFWPAVKDDMGLIRQKGIEYIIINNMSMSKEIMAFHDKLNSLYSPVAQFSPYEKEDFRRSYDEVETTCIPVGSEELFSRQKFGPYISIYKIK